MFHCSYQWACLRNSFSLSFAGNPAIEDRLLAAAEHLQPQGHPSGVAFGQAAKKGHLHAVGGRVVVGFPEVDHPGIAGDVESWSIVTGVPVGRWTMSPTLGGLAGG